MTGEEFVKFHAEACEKMQAICKAKNADYAGAKGGKDAFANFRMVEHLGVASVEQGMLTRMCDKFSRLASFIEQGTLQVKDESIQDTLLDFANYCILLAGYLRQKNETTVTLTGEVTAPDNTTKRVHRNETICEDGKMLRQINVCEVCGLKPERETLFDRGWRISGYGEKAVITCGRDKCHFSHEDGV